MSAKEIYDKRFGRRIDSNINDATAEIDVAHTDIMSLLDVIIEIGEADHFDQDHLYATARSAMARLAEVEGVLREVDTFCAKALSHQRVRGDAEAEKPSDDTPVRAAGGLSASIERVRGGGISDRIDNFARRSVGGYRFDHGDANRSVGGLSGFRRGDEA